MRIRSFMLLGLLACGLPPALAAENQNPASSAEKPQDIGHQVPPGWGTDYQAGVEVAATADHPLLLMFCIPHCGPCNALKASVLPLPAVRRALAEYELVYINAEVDPKVAVQFKIGSYPTFVLLSARGKELGRFSGGSDQPQTFLDGLEALSHRQAQIAAIKAALEKNPKDAALHVAYAMCVWDVADHTMRQEPLMKDVETHLKTAAELDPADATGAQAELAYLAFFQRLRDLSTSMKREAVATEALKMLRAHPRLHRADLLLWTAATALPESESMPLWIELARSYPKSPQVDQAWQHIESAVRKTEKSE